MVKSKSLRYLFYTLCFFTIVIDLFFMERKTYFSDAFFSSVINTKGFYALFALFGSILIFVVTKIFAKFLQVNEEYYDDDF